MVVDIYIYINAHIYIYLCPFVFFMENISYIDRIWEVILFWRIYAWKKYGLVLIEPGRNLLLSMFLLGQLVVCFNPHKTGLYNPQYTANYQGFFSSLN